MIAIRSLQNCILYSVSMIPFADIDGNGWVLLIGIWNVQKMHIAFFVTLAFFSNYSIFSRSSFFLQLEL